MQSRRFRADIKSNGGGRIAILSTTWQTVSLMAPQDHGYRAFITELHRRMAAAGSKAALIGGIGPKTYAAALVMVTLLGIAMVGLSRARACDPVNGTARCSWSASPHCSPGRSAASSDATGRAATISIICRKRCCRKFSQSSAMKRDFAARAACGIVPARFPIPDEPAVTDRSTRLPTAAEIAAINAEHLVITPLKPADLLFVFGTRVDVDERVDEAVRLWREGYFRWSIVSGGITPGSDRSECDIIADAMMARGIPAEIILREDRAMNTGENVIFSLPIIDAALGLSNIRSVICLGNSWTARRYPMTLHRHWPEVESKRGSEALQIVCAQSWEHR